MGRRPRILLAVEPALYEAALSLLLERADIDDIVSMHASAGDVAGTYDVAVVSGRLPAGVESVIVIRLPDDDSGIGNLTIEAGARRRVVAMTQARHLFDAIDDLVPGTRRRSDVLDVL